MGEVYRARDTKLGRPVALKILPDPSSTIGIGSRASSGKRTPRVAQPSEYRSDLRVRGLGWRAGIVLELVGGPTLADRIAQGAIPLEDALPIARQIAEALEAAHDKGSSTAI